ncbi:MULTISPECIES: HNH endonuclease [unclassified Cryobacterium]|uniref:HNH endonuclease n=1 Tax=unclassified Cryobacterium TaxID=2649013 RepID=UPI001F5483E1
MIPWHRGGKTTIDNGVLLCWYHHHTIDTSGWQIRMVRGKPEVRAPYCYDPTRTWRPAGEHRAGAPRSRQARPPGAYVPGNRAPESRRGRPPAT